MVADYDAVNHQLTNARLSDGTPIPIGEIGRIAVAAVWLLLLLQVLVPVVYIFAD